MKKTDSLKGHTAIVTGACGGIGAAFSRELASRGCGLVLVDLNADALLRLRDSLPADLPVLTFPYDLTKEDAATRIFLFCEARGEAPDILINNAGIFSFRPVAETSDERIDTFIDLHIRAVTNLSVEFVRRREKTGSGWLLNMSSMSCWTPMPGIALYASTKAYIRVFSRALHYEMRDSGVKVMAACPGGIATDLFGLPPSLKKLALGLGAIARPETFARKAVERLMKGKMQYVNGLTNRLGIFFTGITPTSIRMLIKHKMLDKGIRR